jgi:hypothetical protein
MQLRRLPRALTRLPFLPELSSAARTRLQALMVWHQTGNWQLAAEVFCLSRATLFRWRRRYVATDLSRLESRSRRPRRVRRPQTPPAIIARLRGLRQQYPRWGREKLRVLLRREGIFLSAKTIDRVLARLRARGELVEPPRQALSARGGAPHVLMRSGNRATLSSPRPAISCKSIPWMCDRYRASSSSSLRHGMSCPAGTWWRPTAAPPV